VGNDLLDIRHPPARGGKVESEKILLPADPEPRLEPADLAMFPAGGATAGVCPEGHHRCLAGVPPSEVAGAALALLRDPAPAGVSSSPPWVSAEKEDTQEA